MESKIKFWSWRANYGSKLSLLYWVLVVMMALLVFSFPIAPHAGAQTTVPIQLSISPPSFTFSSGRSTTFTATLMDTNKNPLASKTISWNATAGSLSAMSGTTNSYGQVSVIYTAPTVDVQTSVIIIASFAGDAYYSSGSATSSGMITAASLFQLEPVEDAYIDRDHSDSNYGTATTLVWQYTGGFPPDRYRSYLKFDISSIPRSCYIMSATLYLYTVTVPPVAYWTGDSFDVLSVSHDGWTENGITWNNAPPFIETIVDRPGGRIPSGAWISNDVTSFVRREYDIGDTLVSFGIKVNGWDGTLTQANSRGATTSHPYLEISISTDSKPPTTFNDYDRLWHTSDFTILFSAIDDLSGVAETYYRINQGELRVVSTDGQPRITTERANNTLEYWSVDTVDNEELPHKMLTGIKLDKTVPTGSVIINDGNTYTTSTSVTLTLTSTDATSGVYKVRYSNDGVWDTETWEGFSSTKTWTLTSGDGTKTVYYQIKDNAGLISETYLDTIVFQNEIQSGSDSILDNGGFEKGSLTGWTLLHGDIGWFERMPVGATPAGEVPYEGNWRVYTNPNDHDSPALCQNIDIHIANFTLSWGILPHSGSYPRLVIVTAYDSLDQPLIDDSGNLVELTYSMVGDYQDFQGYKIVFPIETRNPNTGISAWEYFERDFSSDYLSAGGHPSDFEGASYLKLTFQACDGSGGTSWDAFSITLGTEEQPLEEESEPITEPEPQEEPDTSEEEDSSEIIMIDPGEEFTITYQITKKVMVFNNDVKIVADAEIEYPLELEDFTNDSILVDLGFGSELSTITAKLTGFIEQTGGFYPTFNMEQQKTKYAIFDQQEYYFKYNYCRFNVEITDPENILLETSYIIDSIEPLVIEINPQFNITEEKEVSITFDIEFDGRIDIQCLSGGWILQETTIGKIGAPEKYQINFKILPKQQESVEVTDGDESDEIPSNPLMALVIGIAFMIILFKRRTPLLK